MRETRKTVQKEIVLNTVNKMCNHPTAEMIYNAIIDTYGNISKATVYRILKQLVERKEIACVKVINGADRFDARKEKHYHIQCISCQKVIDAPVPVWEELTLKAQDVVDIQILGHHVIFDGICKQCQK